MRTLLLVAAAFAAYEALTVQSTGRDVFYPVPVEGEYRTQAAIKWAAGAVALGIGAALIRAK